MINRIATGVITLFWLAMMTYNVDDIQQFFYGDMRFLEQFA